MKILHCPAGIGGNAWILSRAERKLGLDSDVMVYQDNWLGYQADVNLQLRRSSPIRSMFTLLFFFLRAMRRYDVLHFNFGSSFLPFLPKLSFLDLADLPVIKGIGKKIVVTCQGSDIRQKDFCASNFAISPYGGRYGIQIDAEDRTDLLKRKHVEKLNRYAHKLFARSPDLLHFLPPRTELLPCTSIDPDEWRPASGVAKSTGIRILHAPTNRNVKGTKYIVEAIEKLKGKYKDVELVLVENIPHHRVRELYTQADIAIDQLLVGWYGAFAVEMMALGKPVVCYIREGDLKFTPAKMKKDLPIINADPGNLYKVLEQLMEERDRLEFIGEQSRSYVETWHDPMKIAMRMEQVYTSL